MDFYTVPTRPPSLGDCWPELEIGALSDQPKMRRTQTPTFYFENLAEVIDTSVHSSMFFGINDAEFRRSAISTCGVPDGTVLNRIVRVRERLYACCAAFEGEESG